MSEQNKQEAHTWRKAMQYRAARECVTYWPDERGIVPQNLLKTKNEFHLRPEKFIRLGDFWETERDAKCYSQQVWQTSFEKNIPVNLAHSLWIHASFWRTLELFQRQKLLRDGVERSAYGLFRAHRYHLELNWTEHAAVHVFTTNRRSADRQWAVSVITTRTYCALLWRALCVFFPRFCSRSLKILPVTFGCHRF